MSQQPQAAGAPGPSTLPTLPPSGPLPLTHLESLKFKASQLIDSIQSLAYTLEHDISPAMPLPPWPDILNKYSILLSQTHTFSVSLASVPGLGAAGARANADGEMLVGGTGDGRSGLAKLALHPSAPLTDAALDNEVIPLLRNQQTTEVLKQESATVRRLAEHMATRGILGVLGMEGGGAAPQVGSKRKVEYEDVMRECENIRDEHDRRVDRAVRAVGMLREKYEWRARVEVEVEEPEELDFDEDSFMGGPDGMDVVGEQNGEENGGEFGSEGSSDGDEEELENVLGTGADGTPDHEPEDAVMTG